MNYEAVPTPETIPAFLPHSAGTEAEKHGCLAHGRAILAKNVKHDGKDQNYEVRPVLFSREDHYLVALYFHPEHYLQPRPFPVCLKFGKEPQRFSSLTTSRELVEAAGFHA